MKSSLLLCIASIIPVTGWAARYPATYNSIPQGATVVCGNSVKGTTPYTGYFSAADLEAITDLNRRRAEVDKKGREAGIPEHIIQQNKAKIDALGCRAIWTSGATALYDVVDANTAKQYPNGIDLLVNHPGDADTRSLDAGSVQSPQLQPQQQQVQQQQPIPVFQPQALPAMPPTSFPTAPGRTTTICRTLSNGTVVCD